jgi:hypothetical protein
VAKWVRTICGRSFIPFDIARPSKAALAENADAYAALQERQYDVIYSFGPKKDPELDTTKRALEAGELTPRHIGSQRPDWAVARSQSADDQEALAAWLDRRREANHPSVVPKRDQAPFGGLAILSSEYAWAHRLASTAAHEWISKAERRNNRCRTPATESLRASREMPGPSGLGGDGYDAPSRPADDLTLATSPYVILVGKLKGSG